MIKNRLFILLIVLISIAFGYTNKSIAQAKNNKSTKKGFFQRNLTGSKKGVGPKGSNYRRNHSMSTFRGGPADYDPRNNYWNIGGHIGVSNTYSDLSPSPNIFSTDLGLTRLGFGANFGLRCDTRFSIRSSLSWVRLRGDDFYANLQSKYGPERYTRNLHFRNDVIEFSVVGIVDLIGNRGSYKMRADWTPYAGAGLEVFYHNPKALAPVGTDSEGKWVALQPLGTEGQGRPGYGKPYSLVQIGIPIVLGVRHKLSEQLDISFEIGWRITTTNYLDDVGSRYYADPAVFGTDNLARMMADRSQERVAASANQSRDINLVNSITNGEGYAKTGKQEIRASSGDADIYVVTGFHLNYIIPTKAFAKKGKHRW